MTIEAPFIGVSRHRIGIDGDGVTTLAAFHGCPLHCHHCLNPKCLGPADGLPVFTPEQLYEKTLIDQLYFLVTGGGVCFGGGEPLLRPDFICRFRELCGPAWQLTVETSLNVPLENLKAVLPVVNALIVDIKDLHPDIYLWYTGMAIDQTLLNLKHLLEVFPRDSVVVRVPLIPGFNTTEDVDRNKQHLIASGFTRIETFRYRTLKK